jgi:hypothetical protein
MITQKYIEVYYQRFEDSQYLYSIKIDTKDIKDVRCSENRLYIDLKNDFTNDFYFDEKKNRLSIRYYRVIDSKQHQEFNCMNLLRLDTKEQVLNDIKMHIKNDL